MLRAARCVFAGPAGPVASDRALSQNLKALRFTAARGRCNDLARLALVASTSGGLGVGAAARCAVLAPAAVLAERLDIDEDEETEQIRDLKCPASLLASLVIHDNVEVCRDAAANSRSARRVAIRAAPDLVLANDLTDAATEVCYEVAGNPHTPPAVLAGLSRSYAAVWLAENATIPAAALAGLICDPNIDVRCPAVGNPNCHESMLRGAASDESFLVRSAAARNPGCSSELLEVLSLDDHFYVRRSVAQHPVCPTTALHRLAADDNTDVSSETRTRLAERRLGAGAAPPQN